MTGSVSLPAEIVARLRAAGCVFAEDEARLLIGAAGSPVDLEAMVARRVAGLPLEHVLGWAEFCGLRIEVEPGVFVPRRRTEFLARTAASLTRPGAVVVDLCCGSGAVAAAVATQVGGIEVHAADVDPAAVRCARRNLATLGGRVYEGDLGAPLPARLHGTVEVLVANVPYVPSGQIATLPPEARLHEPREALDGGSDGLSVLRRVAALAPGWLAPGGHVLVETSARQATAAAEAMAATGCLLPHVINSQEHAATVLIGQRHVPGR
jgi:release factor glutamine methyltransferase